MNRLTRISMAFCLFLLALLSQESIRADALRERSLSCSDYLGIVHLGSVDLRAGNDRLTSDKILALRRQGWDYERIYSSFYEPQKIFTEHELSRIRKTERIHSRIDRVIVTLTSPLWGLIVLGAIGIVKLESRGPAVLVQNRIGKEGRPIRIYKLRTLNVNLSTVLSPNELKSRATRFGRIARRWKIDEFLQMINVVKGEMLLVGPRPLMEKDIDRSTELTILAPYRLLVKPGVTSWNDANLDPKTEGDQIYVSKIEHDLYGIKRSRLWLSAKTLVKTGFSILLGRVSP